MKSKFKVGAFIFFGIVFPLIALMQAANGIQSLSSSVSEKSDFTEVTDEYIEVKGEIGEMTSEDYAIISLFFIESANQNTLINKQIMKVAIINIGFSVISIGMMLIIFGINDGGGQASSGFGDIKFDLKTGSTGVAMFLIGSIMATTGAVLKNEYVTSPIPNYFGVTEKNSDVLAMVIESYDICVGVRDTTPSDCFYNSFKGIKKEFIK